ncbi:hypothetical protein BGZ96_002963 [Linnemannia gamsii]|uniref:Uncharacterized protein n=1 Tax=Linnemannia gamsii TaxID=64522 RepID=A0ABQ7KFY0_9FUNG|nr:hypothetical protein BGZ96_002963 [Linnemannia gamsii]
MPCSFRISSAAGVVGPFAPSTTILCSRNQNIGFKPPKFIRSQRLGTGETHNAARLSNVFKQFKHFNPGRPVKGTRMVLHGYDFGARCRKKPRSNPANVTKTLNCNPCSSDVQTNLARTLAAYNENPAGSRFFTPKTAA